MQKLLGINNALQTIQGEVTNDASKLTEINECIKNYSKKLNEVEDDTTVFEEQR